MWRGGAGAVIAVVALATIVLVVLAIFALRRGAYPRIQTDRIRVDWQFRNSSTGRATQDVPRRA
jgi:hypothetical protein